MFAGIRILLSLLAWVVILGWSWPYMYLERAPDDPLRGAEAWTNKRSLRFEEVVEKLPSEPAWLILPVVIDHQWSDGPAKQLVYTSGGLGLAGVLMDVVAVNRELAAAAVRRI